MVQIRGTVRSGKAKHPVPRTLHLVTPSKQHLGVKERTFPSPPSPLHAIPATGTACSPDTSALPWTSHSLDGVLFTSSFFALIF